MSAVPVGRAWAGSCTTCVKSEARVGDAFVLFSILEALASFQSKRPSPPALVMLVFGGEECSDKLGKLFLTEVASSCPSACGRMDKCFSSIYCGITYLGCGLPLLEVTRKESSYF